MAKQPKSADPTPAILYTEITDDRSDQPAVRAALAAGTPVLVAKNGVPKLLYLPGPQSPEMKAAIATQNRNLGWDDVANRTVVEHEGEDIVVYTLQLVPKTKLADTTENIEDLILRGFVSVSKLLNSRLNS